MSAFVNTKESKVCLLLFYQSGCGHCETAIEGLKKNYKEIVTKEIKIISIAGDTDQNTFSKAASTFPWTDKYRDLEGMNGINFKNYAVLGTPTMYVIDQKGTIIQKPATVEELLEWSRKYKDYKLTGYSYKKSNTLTKLERISKLKPSTT